MSARSEVTALQIYLSSTKQVGVDDTLIAAVRPMMATSQGRLIALSTPAGKRGFFYEAWTGSDDWHRVCVTADQCPRISKTFLQEELRELGAQGFRRNTDSNFLMRLKVCFRATSSTPRSHRRLCRCGDDAEATSAPLEAAPVFLPRRHAFFVGLDLGQSSDPSAVAVLERQDEVLDFNTPWERHTGCGTIAQKKSMRLLVRHLERLKLHSSYPDQVAHVKQLMCRPPLCGDGDRVKPAELILDRSGVGAAVSDIFDAAGLRPIKVVITAGNEVTAAGHNTWHVSKTHLISGVDAALHAGELLFADKLSEALTMKDELLDFRRFLSASGRSTYAARSTAHDDLVLAVSVAVWWATRPPPVTAQVGRFELLR